MSKLSIIFLLVFFSGLISALSLGSVWSFYLYEFVYFMNPGHRWWSIDIPQLGYSFVVVVVMMITYFIHKKDTIPPKLSEIPATKWLIALVVIFLMMFFFAIDPATHKIKSINFFKLMIVMGFAFKMIDNPQKLDHALFVYLVGCAYIGIEADNMGRNSDGRVEGIGTIDASDSNLISATIAPAIPFLLYYFWKGSWGYKLSSMVLGALILNGLVLINSRGAFLGVLGGTFYFIFHMLFSKVQAKYQRSSAIVVILLGFMAVVVVTDDVFWERMETLTSSEESETGEREGAGRMDFWKKTLDMLDSHPMGLGVGGFEALSSQYLEKEQLAKGTSIRSVHSTWFQALGELGWQGLIIFLCLLGSSFNATRKLRLFFIKNEHSSNYFKIVAMEAALMSYLIAGTFINRFRGEVLFWLILFISCSTWIYLKKNEKNNATKN